MATRIFVTTTTPTLPIAVEVIDHGEQYTLWCSGADPDNGHECPGGLEPGDTWSSLEPAMQEAAVHVTRHERAAGLCQDCGHSLDEFVQDPHRPNIGRRYCPGCGTWWEWAA
jgi:hypothetical protein